MAGIRLIGRAILRYLPLQSTREIEVGFALYPQFWGRWIATEVVDTCTALVWGDLGAAALVGVTTPANRTSQRVLLKFGLHYDRFWAKTSGCCCWSTLSTSNPVSSSSVRYSARLKLLQNMVTPKNSSSR
ncbi:MAG: GNAT family N-acetyltransferase [bacterium]|nr:GNAT family N-acetyltransferase [bacterium]